MVSHSDDALSNAEAGVGFKTANSSADSSSVVLRGSTLQAGGNLNLTSTSGDIHVVQGNLSAGNTVSNISLKADGDTTLRGVTATADRIDVNTGGTLTIESLQDIAENMSQENQVGGPVQVSFGTAWDVSGYASAGKANSSYKGVGQQSGPFAGEGGYHVDAGHVNLIGGAIASTNAANSELTAETFSFTDLQNEMDYRASSAGISGGFGFTGKGATDASCNPAPAPGAAGQFKDIGNTIRNGEYGAANSASFSPGIPMSESGHDRSTTAGP